MSKAFFLALFFLGCITQLSIASSDEISRHPNPFPRRARYKAALITTKRSKLCPDCLFETPVGDFHEINADLGLGKITWEFRVNNSTAENSNDLNIKPNYMMEIVYNKGLVHTLYLLSLKNEIMSRNLSFRT